MTCQPYRSTSASNFRSCSSTGSGGLPPVFFFFLDLVHAAARALTSVSSFYSGGEIPNPPGHPGKRPADVRATGRLAQKVLPGAGREAIPVLHRLQGLPADAGPIAARVPVERSLPRTRPPR